MTTPTFGTPLTTTVATGDAGHAALHNAERARLNSLVSPYRSLAMRNRYADVQSPLPVVSFRIDDANANDLTVANSLNTRKLVAGFAINNIWVNASGKLTTANCVTIQGQGHELMHHSRTHGNSPANDDVFYDEVITAADELRSTGLLISSFAQPGTWTPQTTANPYNLDSDSKFDGRVGQAIQSSFLAAQAYTPGYFQRIPARSKFGPTVISYTPAASGSTQDLSYKSQIDQAVASGGSCTFLIHTGAFAAADFTNLNAFLDYVAAQRDSGRLLVMTPTAGLLAKPGPRVNLLADPGFETYATNAAGSGWTTSGTPTVVAGRTGQGVQMTAGQALSQYVQGGYAGLEIVGWAKAPTGLTGTAFPSAGVYNAAGTRTLLVQGPGVAVTDAAWTLVRTYVGCDPATASTQVIFSNSGAGTVIWDDVAVYLT